MMRRPLTPIDIRNRAARLAREAAREREACGDPEGAGVIRDLANEISRIRTTEDV